MSWEIRQEREKREREMEAFRKKREEFGRDLKTVARLPEGERLLERLLDYGQIFANVRRSGEDAAYAAGKKAAALELWHTLRLNLEPESFIRIALAVTNPQRNERPGQQEISPDPDRDREEFTPEEIC